MVVFVEASVMEDTHVTSHAGFPLLKDKLMNFREGQDDLTDKIDFIICLGGDGTLLYASSLFQVGMRAMCRCAGGVLECKGKVGEG